MSKTSSTFSNFSSSSIRLQFLSLSLSTAPPSMWNSTENAFSRSTSFKDEAEDEEELQWAALQRLPTYSRIRRGIFRDMVGEPKEIKIGNLEASEQRLLLDRLVKSVDHDPEQFFARVRKRFDA